MQDPDLGAEQLQSEGQGHLHQSAGEDGHDGPHAGPHPQEEGGQTGPYPGPLAVRGGGGGGGCFGDGGDSLYLVIVLRGWEEISVMETPLRKRILIKKRKIKEQMKIILAQYFEIFQISSSGKIL